MDSKDIAAIAEALKGLLPSQSPAGPATVSAVAIKLPSFWNTRPEVWFRQVEAQFATRNPPITSDETRFNYVVAALDSATAGEVEKLIMFPPSTGKYDALKGGLVDAFGKSQAVKDNELLSLAGLGDRKPSSMLRYIESLNADPQTLLRAVFMAQMPTEVRRILAGSSTTDLHALAKEADAIMEANSSFSASVSAVKPAATTSGPSPRAPYVCQYHYRFKEKAHKCNRNGCTLSHLVPHPKPSGNDQAGR